MKRPIALILTLAVYGLRGPMAFAQQDLEPGVQTSAAVEPEHAPTPPASAAPPSVAASSNVAKAPATTAAAARTNQSPKPGVRQAAPKGDTSAERVDLNATQISGNRELPKVMYVVPWRRAELGDFAGRPPNSLLDEALTPIDRDVFKRQNRYFTALQQQAESAKSQPDAPSEAPAPPRPKDEK